MDWRQKIENQRGAVLATELKNNANKLARWTSAALVAGVDLIKLGYVARAHPRDRHHHVILSTQVGALLPLLMPSVAPYDVVLENSSCCTFESSDKLTDGLCVGMRRR